jgi:hypothetical protein
MKREWIAIITVLVILALACNVPGQVAQQTVMPTEQAVPVQPGEPAPTSQPPDNQQQADQVTQEAPTEEPTATEMPSPTPTEIPSKPVSIREGLSSLNSYIISISLKSTGPTTKDLTDMKTEIQFSRDADTSLTHIHSVTSTASNPDTSTGDSYVYRIKDDECSGSKDSWTFNSMTPAQRELMDIYKQMLDVTPLIGDPVLVGGENVNGIDTNHFSFKLKGLGATSGAEVTANQGDYWLAIDGSYIVRYSLVMETRSGPKLDVLHQDIHIELTNINQAVPAVVFPQGCIAAKNKQ